LVGHPDIHRALKELVKFDSELEGSSLEFSQNVASLMVRCMDDCLKTRASWIFVELLEHDNTRDFVLPELKKQQKLIEEMMSSKDLKGNVGLQMILQKLTGQKVEAKSKDVKKQKSKGKK
jgi:hypothetical protein